jgi:hypothetical protein
VIGERADRSLGVAGERRAVHDGRSFRLQLRQAGEYLVR